MKPLKWLAEIMYQINVLFPKPPKAELKVICKRCGWLNRVSHDKHVSTEEKKKELRDYDFEA